MWVVYNGVRAEQTTNNDIILFKNGRMVLHVLCKFKATKQDLIEIINKHFDIVKNL